MRIICIVWTVLNFVFMSPSAPPKLWCCDNRLNLPNTLEVSIKSCSICTG